MILSITENILNLQQISTCKRFFQVGRDYELIHDAGRISAELAKDLARSENEKFNTARLEREFDQADKDFDRVVRRIESKREEKKGKQEK